MTTLAKQAYGSWADDAYWGTDKFFFYEDNDFYTNPASQFNVMDNQHGARLVIRHCEFRGGNGGVSTHGFEGREEPGIKQIEFYNNYLQLSRAWAQHRSGSILFFNNWSTSMQHGPPFMHYRANRANRWHGQSGGDNRYDDNANGGAVLYSGTVTAVNVPPDPAPPRQDFITDSNAPNFNNIVFDGHAYGIVHLDAGTPSEFLQYPERRDPGWRYFGSQVVSVNGKTLGMINEGATLPKFLSLIHI